MDNVHNTQGVARKLACMKRLEQAINTHDIDLMAACFDPDYQSEFPAHLDRAFRGHGPMRKNWTLIFGSVPDMHATLLRAAVDGDTVWTEWDWHGTRAGGLPYTVRGVTIQTIPDDRITHAWLYMEPVQETGPGPFGAVQETTTGRSRPGIRAGGMP